MVASAASPAAGRLLSRLGLLDGAAASPAPGPGPARPTGGLALALAHPGLPEPVAAWLGCRPLGAVAAEALDPGEGPLHPLDAIQVGEGGRGAGQEP